MRNLKALMANAGKIMTGVCSYVTLASYLKSLNDDAVNQKLDKKKALSTELQKRSSDFYKAEISAMKQQAIISDLTEHQNNVKSELLKTNEAQKKVLQSNLTVVEKKSLESDIQNHVSNASTEVDKSSSVLEELQSVADKILNPIGSGSGSGYTSNFLNDTFSTFNDFLSRRSLSTDKLGALSHIFISLFVLICLFSIISVHYGDFLIKYFKIEELFPWLSRFIKLRRKFREYYFILNIILIVIALVSIIYVDILVLLK